MFNKHSKTVILVVLLLTNFGLFKLAYAAGEETLARQAEQTGKLRQALTHYVEALKADTNNQKLREKIIKLAQKIKPPPAVPEEAERHLFRGEAAVEIAKDESGFNNAAKEFQAAMRLVPWLADGYYNLFVVLEKAGNYAAAIRNAKLYLLSMPEASDAAAVRKSIVKLEYKQEHIQASESQKQADEKKQRQVKSRITELSGQWQRVKLWNTYDTVDGTPWREGQHWLDLSKTASADVFVQGDSIKIKVQLYGGTKIYEGEIIDNRVHGRMETKTSCGPINVDFKGEVWPEDNAILILARGFCDGNRNFQYNNYRSSYLLQR